MSQDNQQEPLNIQFAIQRVYVKDTSFEVPNAPKVFTQKWEPELTLDLNFEHTQLEEQAFEVVLTLTATVKNEGAVAFLVEVKQAGIFTLGGVDAQQLGHLLGSYCPSILYPYAREAITSLVLRGSFPQLVLAPINFDALYFQKAQEQMQAETAH